MSDIAVPPLRDVSAACATCGLFHLVDAACPVASTLSVRSAGYDASPGAVLGGRFEVIDVVHRSGMSTIYRARNMSERAVIVAVKQVSVHDLSPEEQAEARRWLAREAGLLSSLNDPLLPDLIAAFSEGDEHYVVMPFLRGRTLTELVKQSGPLEVYDALSYTRALIGLLIHLHGHHPPIIHRDLKPDNILIMPDRTLKVLDLGIARPLVRGVPGTAIGTPGYAAPEQYQGLADERSDIYSLGATLHYMLTGYDAKAEAPFRHPPMRQLNPALSPVTEAFVSKLLRLAPGERPTSATALLDCLERFECAHLNETITANYSRHLQRLTTRVLPLSLACVGIAVAAHLTPGRQMYEVSAFGLPMVPALCIPAAVSALRIPDYTAKTIHADQWASLRTQNPNVILRISLLLLCVFMVPTAILAISLLLLCIFVVPTATQWTLLPAELVLPYLVTAAGWWRAEAQSRQAQKLIVDFLPAQLKLPQG